MCSFSTVVFVAAESLEDALKQLYLIDAIDENGVIRSIGRTMAGLTLASTFEEFYSNCMLHYF